MNIALVEDNEIDTRHLVDLLRSFEKQNKLPLSIDCFNSGSSFLENFEKYKYSIIFMDIFMADKNGIETALSIRETDQSCIIIFLTSSNEFLHEAFSCHAFEYIQKPATEERVFHVLNDALQFLPQTSRVFKFSCSRQTIRLLYSDIVCVVANGHNTDITDSYGTTLSPYSSFSEFIKPLISDSRFLLINKGILVNMDHVMKFENKICLLTGDISLPVRVREYAQIEQAWLDYTFAQIHAGLAERNEGL